MTSHAAGGASSHIFISQRLRLHYLDWGNPDAPPLILLHGGRDHCRNWDWVAQDLCKDWHVIAPDLRGHGDSAWTNDGQYSMAAYVYDLAQLIHQLKLAPLAIVAHSLGGNIALRYTGLYPQTVNRLVVIEGLGPLPSARDKVHPAGVVQRMQGWVDEQRKLAARQPKRYATIDEACQRMHAENKHLSKAQAHHLTYHGVTQNEDGSYSWKFDNYVRTFPPDDLSAAEIYSLWSRISCPVMLVHGTDSWVKIPDPTGPISNLGNYELKIIDHAGHWLHHDQTSLFTNMVREFLTPAR